MSRRTVLSGLAALGCGAWMLPAQENSGAVFGTTVTSSAGLQGHVYLIPDDTEELPNFKRLKPVGTLYTTSLGVPPRAFREGFPGIVDRFEWFAIDYTGRFWIEKTGRYRFHLLSDDGSKLYLDDKVVVDNDGVHPPRAVEGSAELSRGVHRLRVSYFQGQRFEVALVLTVAGPDNDAWRIFDTNEFRPPADPAEWTAGTIRAIKKGSNF